MQSRRYRPGQVTYSAWRTVRAATYSLLLALLSVASFYPRTLVATPPNDTCFATTLGEAIQTARTNCCGVNAKDLKTFETAYAKYGNKYYLSLRDLQISPYVAQQLTDRGFSVHTPDFNHALSNSSRGTFSKYTCIEPQILLDVYNGNNTPLYVDLNGRIRYGTINWLGPRKHPKPAIPGTTDSVTVGGEKLNTCALEACSKCQETLVTLDDARNFLDGAGLEGRKLPIRGPGRYIPPGVGRYVPGATGFGVGLGTGLAVDWGTTEGLVGLGIDREEAQHWGGGAGFGAGWMAGEGAAAYMGGSQFFSVSGAGGLAISGPAAAIGVHTHIMTKEICPNTMKAVEGMEKNAREPIRNTYLDQMTLDKNREETDTLIEINSYGGLGAIWYGIKYWTGNGPAGGIGGGW